MYHFCIKCVSVWVAKPSMADTLGSIKRYVSVGVCIQTNTQLLNVNAANLHRFPEVLGRSRRGTTFPSTRPALSPWCPVLTPANPTERGWSLNRKWVGQSDFAWFLRTSLKQNPRGLVCTLWQFSSLSAIGGSRSFVFNITIFIFFNLLLFRFNLLIKTNKI